MYLKLIPVLMRCYRLFHARNSKSITLSWTAESHENLSTRGIKSKYKPLIRSSSCRLLLIGPEGNDATYSMNLIIIYLKHQYETTGSINFFFPRRSFFLLPDYPFRNRNTALSSDWFLAKHFYFYFYDH